MDPSCLPGGVLLSLILSRPLEFVLRSGDPTGLRRPSVNNADRKRHDSRSSNVPDVSPARLVPRCTRTVSCVRIRCNRPKVLGNRLVEGVGSRRKQRFEDTPLE
jgi:hypothetical protein